MRACTQLRHFQVRPLHDSAREQLLAALTPASQLTTLICSPRLRSPTVEWTGCLFRREDLARLVLPTLRNFELDAWTPARLAVLPDAPVEVTPSILAPARLASNLVSLRLRFDATDEHLNALLAGAGETLVRADIYMERPVLDIDRTAAALSFGLASLRELRYTVNAPIEGFAPVDPADILPDPLFDRLLPKLESLQRLTISATECSSALLSLLPRSLRHLEVQAYTYRGPFKFAQEMLTTLAERSRDFSQLQTLTVCDSEDVWGAEDVAAMTGACASRGVAFRFVADEEGDTDSG